MRAISLALVAWGCYSPSPPRGAPCADNSACPAGQMCIAGVCDSMEPPPDSGELAPDSIPIDAPALCTTWTAEHFDPCAIPAPMGDLVLTNALSGFSWDTSSGELKGRMNTTIPVVTAVISQTGGPDVLVASVSNFTMEDDADLDISGPRPLLIAVWGTATIAGEIDVSASFSSVGPGGSGASTTECPAAPTGNSGASGTPAMGGGGGAFQGPGGRGGNLGGSAGTMLPPPTVIRGGCGGGLGGAGTGATAPRGAGGGAIQISARTSIVLAATGEIEASGGAGSYGRLAYGGGGAGGSGGYIGLDAPMVSIAGVLAANGGSGGGGASDVANGSPGANGLSSSNAAIGGAGAATSNVGACGRGGNGGAGGTLTGAVGGTSSCGGGGGGGGVGYILIWSPMLDVTGTISPPVTGGP